MLARYAMPGIATLTLAVAACGGDDATGGTSGVAIVDTQVTPAQIHAGETATVACLAADKDGALVTGATFTFTAAPDVGLTVAGMLVTAQRAGEYAITCANGRVADGSPATLTVLPGPLAKTTLIVTPETVTAGETSDVMCRAVDAFDNLVEAPIITVDPPTGVTNTGSTLRTEVAGTYEVVCGTANADPSTVGRVTWTVNSGPQVAFELDFSPEADAYELDKSITVSGVAVDAFGNETPGLALSSITVSPDGRHTLIGSDKLRFQAEGLFTVSGVSADNPSLTANRLLVVDQTGPAITLTSPDRGISTNTLTQVTVSGTVQDNLGEVASLSVNGTHLTLPTSAGGAFSTTVELKYGLTFIDVVAADPYGNTTRVTRATERSADFYPLIGRTMETDGVENAVVLMLLPEAVDDDDHTEAELDDLASLFKAILDGVDLGALLPNPLFTIPCIGGDCQVTFANFTVTDSDVDLTLKAGRLGVGITLIMPAATLNLVTPTGTALPGTFGSNEITIDTDIVMSVVNGVPQVSAENTVVGIDGISVTIIDPTGLLQGILTGLVTWVESGLIAVMEPLFAALIEDQVAGLLAGLLEALAFDTVFEVPAFVEGGSANRIVLNTLPAGIDIAPERFQVRLDGLAYAESPMRPFPNLGSIDHVGCEPAASLTFPPPSPIAVGLHDNFVNELLFAVWEGATLSLDMGPAETAELVGSFGIQNMNLKVEGHLPPIFNSCGKLGEIAQVGELFLDATFDLLGQSVSIALWLQTEAAVEVVIGENDEGGTTAKLLLGDLNPLLVDVERNIGFFEGNEQGLVDLLKAQLVPLLLDRVTEAATFDLPQFDLGALADGLPAGTIVNIDVQTVGRDGGYLTVNGKLK